MLDYKVMAENDSMYNTPPCWPIYISKLVLEWIRDDIGGLGKMEERNVRKAQLLYDFLDQSQLFQGCADKDSRSIMERSPFVTGDKDLDAKFVKEAAEAGFRQPEGPPQRRRHAGLHLQRHCRRRASRSWWPSCRNSSRRKQVRKDESHCIRYCA